MATRLLLLKVVVDVAGSPVQFTKGRVVSGSLRLSTRGNTGNVYLANSAAEANSAVHRFGIAKDQAFPFKVTELSSLWLDCDTSGDYMEISAEVETNN